MGEVYRAKDTRLQREVAIKVVPESIAADTAALARFEREAQAVAALSHPNILALHDVGRDGDTSYAVMELLTGQTLRAVLQTGPMPTRKALDYGRQIAEGLAAAHERGIVHRDLKPENVFITTDGRAKLLDFGLALVSTVTPESTAETVLGTVRTSPGTVMGTVGYMAPEQVRGLTVDARADIFAFGTLLFEMVSGTRAFGGATAADTLSAILTEDPADLPPSIGANHPGLDRIIRRALEKEPAQRFQSARDLGFALEAIASGSSSAARTAVAAAPRRGGVPMLAVALVGGVLIGAAGWWALAPRPTATFASVQRYTIAASEFQVGAEWVAASPNGSTLAWGGNISTTATQNYGLWIRHMDRPSAEPMRGIDDVRRCTFMDEVRLLCVIPNQLVSIDVNTGRRVVLWKGDQSTERFPIRSPWANREGRIVAGIGNGIAVIDNGVAKMIATAQSNERWLSSASWTPDGRHVVYVVKSEDGSATAYVAPADGGTRIALNLPPDIAGPVMTPDGLLLYGQSGVLWAQQLTKDWQVDGPAVRLGTELGMDSSTGFLSAVATASGMVVYRSPSTSTVQFEWVDRAGRLQRTVGPQDTWANFDVSPDGRVATTRREAFVNGNSLFLFDARPQPTELGHFEGQSHSDPTFSADGKQLAFRRGNQLVIRTLQGKTERVARDFIAYPDSWSRDGRYLAVGRPVPTGYDGWVIDLQDPSKDVAVVTDMVLTDEMRFSPDGKWIAFHAAQRGAPEVYVVPFPPMAGPLQKRQISTGGGLQPRWSPDGRTLYFLDPAGQLMAAPIPGGDVRAAGTPVALFRTDLSPSSAMDQIAVAPDDKGFLLRRPVTNRSNEAPVQLILNWRRLLDAAKRGQ